MNTEERKRQAIKQIFGLVGEIEDAQGKNLVAYPDHMQLKMPMGIALALAGVNIPMVQAAQKAEQKRIERTYGIALTEKQPTGPFEATGSQPYRKPKFKKPRHPNARKGRR